MNTPTAQWMQARDNKAQVNAMKANVASAFILMSTVTMENAVEKDPDIGNYGANYWLAYCKAFIDGKPPDDNFRPNL
jgi:hypothetical protein